MGEFKTIETQEEFDAAIKERLERERKTLSEKYSDYEELKKKNTEYEAQVSKLSGEKETLEKEKTESASKIAELDSKVKRYETDSAKTRIALEAGLPYELAARLNGATEDELKQDAQLLAKLVNHKEPAPISEGGEPTTYVSDKNEAVKKLVQNLSKGE
ncbi:MAG: DUF4355 domain-containing protein [Bacteroidales bacterium]|nr:DUF4355 domain-containing protein [Candidatus Scybalousia scybalohippi]